MKALNDYVNQLNVWRTITGSPHLNLNNSADRKEIAEHLDSSLSPENLTCDGELNHSAVQKKYRQLTNAGKQLMQLDPSLVMYELDY